VGRQQIPALFKERVALTPPRKASHLMGKGIFLVFPNLKALRVFSLVPSLLESPPSAQDFFQENLVLALEGVP